MLAYTRVFSGKISVGDEVNVLNAKYNFLNENQGEHIKKATVTGLYVLMGRDVHKVKSAPPGTIVGMTGFEEHIFKSATVTSSPNFISLDRLMVGNKPIVRVVLDTVKVTDLPKLKKGMARLHQADPCVEVLVQGTGEHVLVTAGEVHLERCLTDLRERFCPGIQFTVSKPIVPLRETLVVPPKVDMTNEAINELNVQEGESQHYLLEKFPREDMSDGCATTTTTNKHLKISVNAAPLPTSVVEILVAQEPLLRLISTRRFGSKKGSDSKAEVFGISSLICL